MRDIYVVGGARTAIGTYGGSLRDIPLTKLATTVVKAASERAGLPADEIGHVVLGNVIPTEPQDAYLARVAAIDAGIPKETPAFNVNRLCGAKRHGYFDRRWRGIHEPRPLYSSHDAVGSADGRCFRHRLYERNSS